VILFEKVAYKVNVFLATGEDRVSGILSIPVGFILSIEYSCVEEPVKDQLDATTSKIPDWFIVPPLHIIGTDAGRLQHVQPALPAHEKYTEVITSPEAPYITIVVSAIGLFFKRVGAVIVIAGG
jgi:hypothetical protein